MNLDPHSPIVVLYDPKYIHNLGAAIRSCACFGISRLYWTGSRLDFSTNSHKWRKRLARIPREERLRGFRSVRFQRHDRPFDLFPPHAIPICVEVQPSQSLRTFEHPEPPYTPVYIFGPEDGHVPASIRALCHRFVHIPSHHCLNLAAAINIVLYDRRIKRQALGLEPDLPVESMLHERRNRPAEPDTFDTDDSVLDRIGWDGH